MTTPGKRAVLITKIKAMQEEIHDETLEDLIEEFREMQRFELKCVCAALGLDYGDVQERSSIMHLDGHIPVASADKAAVVDCLGVGADPQIVDTVMDRVRRFELVKMGAEVLERKINMPEPKKKTAKERMLELMKGKKNG